MESDTRKELEATIEARRELGPGHDDQLIAGFLDRIDREIDRRVDEKLARRGPRRHGPPLAASLGPMIPIVIFAGIFGGSTGVVAALLIVAALVLVNELRR